MAPLPNQTRGRPVGDHGAKRQAIAEATWAVIAARGLDGASLRAIAREAGCTTGVLSHYFANKDEILEYALTLIFEHLDARLDDAAAAEDVLTALRDIAATSLPIDAITRREWSVWQSYLSKAEHQQNLAAIIQHRHGAFRDRLTSLIRRGQKEGVIRADFAAGDLADQVNATLDGLIRMAPLEVDRFPPERLVHLVDVQIQLITKQPKEDTP